MEEKPKRLSGAQHAKIRKQRDEEDRRREIERRSSIAGGPLASHLKHFETVGVPPVGNPVAGVAWAHDICSLLLWEVVTDAKITAEQRWRFGSDLVAKLSMTHSKAHMQKRLHDLEVQDKYEAPEDEGLDAYTAEHRPANARRRGKADGGSEIHRPVSEASEPDDG